MGNVKAKIPSVKQTSTAPKQRRERRVLLPSNRVAVWQLPNVGEFLDLRTEALKKCGDQGDIEFGMQFGKLLLRRCLVAMTERPTPTVYKQGFDVVAVRQKAEAEGVENIEAVVIAAEDAAEDVDAMKQAAKCA